MQDATEVAYKNGYSKGMEDFTRELMLIPSNIVRKDEIRNLLREKVGEGNVTKNRGYL